MIDQKEQTQAGATEFKEEELDEVQGGNKIGGSTGGHGNIQRKKADGFLWTENDREH